eukprot:sb/3467630/
MSSTAPTNVSEDGTKSSTSPTNVSQDGTMSSTVNVSEDGSMYKCTLPYGMYLGRSGHVNPRVFLQWGQELAEIIRLSNFSDYGEFEISKRRTIFMRNIRLDLEEALYTAPWTTELYKLEAEAFNSHTGRTSFDLSIRWRVNGLLVATLVRKMVYISLETGKPTSLPPVFVEKHGSCSNPIRFSLSTRVPWTGVSWSYLTVRASDIDFNNHVGHPVYLDYMLDSSASCGMDVVTGERIKRVDIEYKEGAVEGKTLLVQQWKEKEGEMSFILHQYTTPVTKRRVALGKVETW